MKLIVSSVYVAPRPGIILPVYDYAFTIAAEGEPDICLRFNNKQEAELARLDWMVKEVWMCNQVQFSQVPVEQQAADSAAENTNE